MSTEPVAQTNLQLDAQLRRLGWPPDEIAAVARGYLLAARLLAGWYRASDKPFVDHFVGTASVVAAAGERPAMVQAAVLHNAYGSVLGAAGDERRRPEVREAIGAEAEELVWDYASFAWDALVIEDLIARAGDLTDRERDLVVLRLANEVDDRVDLGLVHRNLAGFDPASLIALAEAIDAPGLAAALRRVVAEEAEAGSTVPRVGTPGDGLPYRLVPPRDPWLQRLRSGIRRFRRRVVGRIRWELSGGGR